MALGLRAGFSRNSLYYIVDVLRVVSVRVNILCLEIPCMIYRWKDHVEERSLVPNFTPMATLETSYGALKGLKWAFRGLGLAIALISIIFKNFCSKLFLTFFYTIA